MRVGNKVKRVAGFGGAVGLALAMVVGFQPVAGAETAAQWELAVSPSTGLKHGDPVAVAVSRYAPGGAVLVAQCAIVEKEPACVEGSPREVRADSSGTARFSMVAQQVFKAFRLDGTAVGTVDCSDGSCFIAAADPRVCGPASSNGTGLAVTLSFQ